MRLKLLQNRTCDSSAVRTAQLRLPPSTLHSALDPSTPFSSVREIFEIGLFVVRQQSRIFGRRQLRLLRREFFVEISNVFCGCLKVEKEKQWPNQRTSKTGGCIRWRIQKLHFSPNFWTREQKKKSSIWKIFPRL